MTLLPFIFVTALLFLSPVASQWAIGQYHADLDCLNPNTTLSIYQRLGCVRTINGLTTEIQHRECNSTHYFYKKCQDSDCTTCNDGPYNIPLSTCHHSSVWTCGMPSLATNPNTRLFPFVYKAIRPSANCTDQANDVWILTQQDDCFIIPPTDHEVFTYQCGSEGQMNRYQCDDTTLTCQNNCTITAAPEAVCVDTTVWKDYTTFTCDLNVALNAREPFIGLPVAPKSDNTPSAGWALLASSGLILVSSLALLLVL